MTKHGARPGGAGFAVAFGAEEDKEDGYHGYTYDRNAAQGATDDGAYWGGGRVIVVVRVGDWGG
jgi:hypothetical protein